MPKHYEDEAVGLPGTEEQEYQKPGKPLSKEEASKRKADMGARAIAAMKMRSRKKATGVVESPLVSLEDLIPTKMVTKLGAAIGARALAKLVNLKKASVGADAAKGAARKTKFKAHQDWERFSSELGEKAAKKEAKKSGKNLTEKELKLLAFEKTQEIRNASKRVYVAEGIRARIKKRFPKMPEDQVEARVERELQKDL